MCVCEGGGGVCVISFFCFPFFLGSLPNFSMATHHTTPHHNKAGTG